MATLAPKPGFDWSKVQWGAPDAVVSDRCSYCGAVIPEDAVPLRVWTAKGWAAQFCDDCMVTWWGLERALEPPDEDA